MTDSLTAFDMEDLAQRLSLDSAGSVSIVAPAKLNLYLHLTDKRADGYHLLESVFAFTDGGDKLVISNSDQLVLDISGPFAADLLALGGGGPNNLIFKAAEALRALLPKSQRGGAHIMLEKNLPVAAGIGGGSADAAAALIALVHFWALEIDAGQLADIALKLGADVPASMLSAPCFVQGVGERIRALEPGERVSCLLLNPRKPLSTPTVFKQFAHGIPMYTVAHNFPVLEPFEILHHTHNDLAGAAGALMPELRDGFDALANTRGVQFVRLSGSGPTLFALYEDEACAEEAKERVQETCVGWWAWVDRVQMPATFDALVDNN